MAKQKKLTKEQERQLAKPYHVRFMDGFKILTRSHNPHEVWRDIFEMFAYSIHNSITKEMFAVNDKFQNVWDEREERYLHDVSKYSKKEVEIIVQMFSLFTLELDRNPFQDLAGKLYMELGLGNSNLGQCFTPYSVCQLSAKLTADHESMRKAVKENGWFTCNDCACGAGAMMIALIEKAQNEFKRLNWYNHMLIVVNDIDSLCWHMAYVQLSLLGAPAIVTLSNTLTTPCVDFYETPELVLFTPMYLSNTWTMRRLFHGLDLNMQPAPNGGLFGIGGNSDA